MVTISVFYKAPFFEAAGTRVKCCLSVKTNYQQQVKLDQFCGTHCITSLDNGELNCGAWSGAGGHVVEAEVDHERRQQLQTDTQQH